MSATYTSDIARIRTRLSTLPRVRLANLPTALDECPRLSTALGGPSILIKREDLTGLAFGGNKVRQHEYVLGAAIERGADCLVQGSAAQSNHSRQLAAAGAKLGLDTYLLPKQDEYSSPIQGNYLVDHVLGATIRPIGTNDSTIAAKQKLVEELRAAGRKPYVTGMGATESLVLATVSYVDALFEIVEQMPEGRIPDAIYTASQGSTQGGILLACEILNLPTKVIGIAPMRADHEARIPLPDIVTMIHSAAERIGIESHITADDIELREEFVGQQYGVPSAASIDAIAQLGKFEGILLDPVYSGKAFSGLLADAAAGRFEAGSSVVFVHTGGLPALFAHAETVIDGISLPSPTKDER